MDGAAADGVSIHERLGSHAPANVERRTLNDELQSPGVQCLLLFTTSSHVAGAPSGISLHLRGEPPSAQPSGTYRPPSCTLESGQWPQAAAFLYWMRSARLGASASTHPTMIAQSGMASPSPLQPLKPRLGEFAPTSHAARRLIRDDGRMPLRSQHDLEAPLAVKPACKRGPDPARPDLSFRLKIWVVKGGQRSKCESILDPREKLLRTMTSVESSIPRVASTSLSWPHANEVHVAQLVATMWSFALSCQHT
ncbi:hypothetical protein CSOJ01_03697 [Colletotrichum sojae]|uniref:Uncharacterized protein n=1 Tax=Colletotrichum sojae TaxID=2175907 RepID=A0A8H6N0L9_9PEZI|nr:hypothetical protein CSOJ01_03697 [Colletotrichum sojae]